MYNNLNNEKLNYNQPKIEVYKFSDDIVQTSGELPPDLDGPDE